jgi:hypothetical protein
VSTVTPERQRVSFAHNGPLSAIDWPQRSVRCSRRTSRGVRTDRGNGNRPHSGARFAVCSFPRPHRQPPRLIEPGRSGTTALPYCSGALPSLLELTGTVIVVRGGVVGNVTRRVITWIPRVLVLS